MACFKPAQNFQCLVLAKQECALIYMLACESTRNETHVFSIFHRIPSLPPPTPCRIRPVYS